MAEYAKTSDWVLQLDVKPKGDTEPSWLSVLKGFQTLGEGRSDSTSEYYYLDGFGAAETGTDSTSRTFSTTGHRVYGDPLQDWLFGFDRQWDVAQRTTNYRYFNIKDGKGEQGAVSISFTSTASGAANERAAFGVTISVQGSPAEYKHDLGPYTVTYESNGGEGSVVDDEKYEPGKKAIVKSATDLDGNGDFVQWNTRGDGLGASYLAGDIIEMIDNVTLYAIWRTDDVGA